MTRDAQNHRADAGAGAGRDAGLLADVRAPARWFGGALLLTALMLAWLVWSAYGSYRFAELADRRYLRIERLRGVILHLDEALTMSARMAAATGDGRWERRYRRLEPELDAAIRDAARLAPQQATARLAAQTGAANLRLVAMENRAFALVRAGRRAPARQLLLSPEYEAQKRVYAQGIGRFVDALDAELRRTLAAERRRAVASMAAALAGLAVAPFTWLALAAGLRRWRAGLLRQIADHGRAQEALRESEERFRRVAENVSDVITILEPDGTIRYESPSVERVLGYGPAELLGRVAQDFVHPDDVPAVGAAMARLLQDGAFGDDLLVFRFLHRDGSYRCLEAVGSLLADGPGDRRFLITSRDITERREAEEVARRRQRFLRSVLDTDPNLIFVKDADGRFTLANRAFAEAYGTTVDDLVGKTDFDFNPDRAQVEGFLADDRAMLASLNEKFIPEERLTDATGRTRWMQVMKRPILPPDGGAHQVLGIAVDITERKRSEERLLQIMTSARCLLWHAVVREGDWGGLEWDLRMPNEEAARRWLPIAYEEGEAFSDAWYRAKFEEDRERMDELSVGAIRGGLGHYRQEFRCRLAAGEHRWLSEEVQIEPSGAGEWRLVGICTDITERKAFEQKLAHQAFHDALTGLPNRALFLERLTGALRRAEHAGTRAAVLFLDLDNFKVVNDSLGHEAGDDLLLGITRCLTGVMRPGDTVARMGGDEFTILLEDLQDAGDAGGAAERVLRALEAPFLIAGREVFTTTSIGIAVAGGGDGPLDPHALLRDADTAMYQAKAAGRGRYLCFDPGMNTRAVDRLELETDLRAALEQGAGLLLHFQPIVSLRSGRIQEVEALVRWDHPGRGLIPPGKFIPLAEETGLIVPLGEWVLREACRQAGAWPRSAAGGAAPPGVSVNLSARQLQQPDLVDVVARVLCETGLEPARLQLEITESVMMQEPAATIGRLHRLKGLGVRLAVDDFGTGYSSMAYLSVLPIDTIKIDRSFVLRLGQQAEDSAIIRAIVSLARSLNLRVTSEGIETVAQLAALVALGSDVGQGYYLSAPVDAPAAAALLAAPRPFASQLRAADALADAAPALPVRRAA